MVFRNLVPNFTTEYQTVERKKQFLYALIAYSHPTSEVSRRRRRRTPVVKIYKSTNVQRLPRRTSEMLFTAVNGDEKTKKKTTYIKLFAAWCIITLRSRFSCNISSLCENSVLNRGLRSTSVPRPEHETSGYP